MFATAVIVCQSMMTNETLLTEINRFLERHDMSPSGFGRFFLNNANFVSDLQKGDDVFSPKLKTVNRIRMLMKNYKPEKGVKNGK